jgi:hypothetical protein
LPSVAHVFVGPLASCLYRAASQPQCRDYQFRRDAALAPPATPGTLIERQNGLRIEPTFPRAQDFGRAPCPVCRDRVRGRLSEHKAGTMRDAYFPPLRAGSPRRIARGW